EIARRFGFLDSSSKKGEETVKREKPKHIDSASWNDDNYCSPNVIDPDEYNYDDYYGDDDEEPVLAKPRISPFPFLSEHGRKEGVFITWIFYIWLIIWLPMAGYAFGSDWSTGWKMYWVAMHPVGLLFIGMAHGYSTSRPPWPFDILMEEDANKPDVTRLDYDPNETPD
ncbi:MAG: hypothetical protein VCE74_07530, partial [Alphaproteobacteria bacterium]